MKAIDKQIKVWEKQAITAYHTKAFNQSFHMYWDITESLRNNMTTEEAEAMKKVKLAAWDAEEAKIS